METKGEKQSSFIHPFNINLLTIQGVLERISMSKVVEILRRRSFGTRKAVLAYLKEQGQVEQHKVPFGQRDKVVKSEWGEEAGLLRNMQRRGREWRQGLKRVEWLTEGREGESRDRKEGAELTVWTLSLKGLDGHPSREADRGKRSKHTTESGRKWEMGKNYG